MLKIVHTADWHIGRTLNGWARLNEHAAFLERLAAIVVECRADALVVAGDVFDSMAPNAEARTLFYRTIDRLSSLVPHITTVIISGNHDHAGQLEAPHALLRRHRVHAIGTIARRDGRPDLERHLVPLRDRAGDVKAHVLAVPFLTGSDIPRLPEAANGSPVAAGVRQLYAEMIGAARGPAGGQPLIVTGHLTLAGAAETEMSERRILIGGEHALPHDVFPAELAYVALGHLHRAQEVGRTTIRYAGSPFPMSATERPYRHGVSLVAIGEGGTAVEHVPVERPVPFLRLPEQGALERSEVEGAFAALGLDADIAVEDRPFVHVAVAVDGPASGLRAEIDDIAERYPVRIAALPEIVRPELPAEVRPAPAPPPQLKEMDPVELFTRAFTQQHHVPPGLEHLAAFAEIRGES